MSRNGVFGLAVSLLVCGVVNAQPQTVSYHSGTCPFSGTCNIVDSLPAQGFVLTDIITVYDSVHLVSLDEVIGANSIVKTLLKFGAVGGCPQSYHMNSGIPFSGSSGITVTASSGGLNTVTLVGYIPGTASGSVPALGSFGLGVLLVAMMALGGRIIRRKHVLA